MTLAVAAVSVWGTLQARHIPLNLQPGDPPLPSSLIVERNNDTSEQTNRRFRALATIQANTLSRLAMSESEVVNLREKLLAAAKEQEDMSLRLEMLSRDFHRLPDTESNFVQPVFRPTLPSPPTP